VGAWLAALIVAAAVGAMLLHLVWNGPPNADEGFYLAAGRATLEGAVPVVDYGYTQAPLLPRVLALLVGAGGTSVLAFRLFCAALTAISLLILAVVLWRRNGAGAALATVLAVVAGVPGAYFLVLGKTYALAHLLLVAAAAVWVLKLPSRTRWLLLAFLGTVAVGTRLTVAPSVAVLWLAFAWMHRRELGWWRIVVWPAAGLLLVFVPPFLGDARRAWFWMWEVHVFNTRERHAAAYWRQLLEFSPAVALLTVAALAAMLRRRTRAGSFGLLCFGAGAVGIVVNVASAGLHAEYVTPFLGLVALGASELLQEALGRRSWLVAGVASVFALAWGWRHIPGRGDTLHGEAAAAAAYLSSQVAAEERVLAARPEIPIAAHRPLMPDMVMGVFAITTDFDDATATRLGMVPFGKLTRWVDEGVPAAIVLSARPEENFAGSVPSMRDADLEQQRRFWVAVEARYRVGFRNGFYIVLLRKSAPAPAATP
jgi:hypothetical protein